MRVLHIVHSLTAEAGGNAKAVADLTESLAYQGIKVSIFTTVNSQDRKEDLFRPKDVNLHTFQRSFLARWWTYHVFGFRKTLLKEAYNFDIIHIHDIWHYPNYVGYYASKKIGKPYIITTHGTLEPWALKYKGLKKRIYAALIQKRILKEASAIHAITDEEVKHIRDFGIDNNIVIIPNGINPEDFQILPSRLEVEKLYPELKDKKIILFLGRIHPKKGLDILAKAFGKIARERNDVYLLIVGPDNDGYQAEIEKMLKTEGVLNKAIFTGMLSGRKKLIALSGADLFVLPSYSEGFSMAILEAMISSLPVIITRQCNFPEIAETNAGIVIEPDVDQLSNSLMKLLDKPRLCEEMGANGQHLVMAKFTWDKIAKQMINLYKEILLTHKNKNSL